MRVDRSSVRAVLAAATALIASSAVTAQQPKVATENLPAHASAPAPRVVGEDFQTRCAKPGVIKCVGFDDPADFDTGSGGSAGAYGLNSGIFPPSRTTDYTRAVRDTRVKASGSSSLRFTIPSNSPSDPAGSYFTNFSKDLSLQFGENSEFFIQWRQRFSPELVNTRFAGGGGWKQIIVGTGDQPPRNLSASCTALEVVVQNTYQRGFPQLYNSCTGSSSHGPFQPFEEPIAGSDFKLENGRPAPGCLYSQGRTSFFPPVGNCFAYVANEWLTFQIRIRTGPRVADEFVDSHVTLWAAREGKPSELLIDWGPYKLTAGSAAQNQKFGKVWLLPYHTGKDASESHPTAYTWYDELVISRNRIADP
ncbi:MAG: hypothetical protein ABI460_03080 [Caldimonas sp.]